MKTVKIAYFFTVAQIRCSQRNISTAFLTAFGNDGLVLLQNETNLVGYIMDKAYEKGLQIALNAAPMNEKVLSYPLEKLHMACCKRG